MKTIEVNDKVYKQLKSIQIFRELVHEKKTCMSAVLKEMMDETVGTLW